jgi:ABC-2 type transport system ATP-binding protein
MNHSEARVGELRDAVVLANGFPLLSGVDVEIEPASLTVLTGANGAGKTSLLRLLGGLVALNAGEGSVLGIDLVRGDRRQLRRRVGWLGHEGSFYDDLTVRENLTFAAKALGRPLDDLRVALARMGLASRADTTTKEL